MFSESDMYAPVRDFFISKGYRVSAEVMGVDVVAEKDDVVIAIELKRTLTIELVYQAIDRQKAVEFVYIAVARFKSMRERRSKNAIALCKRLGIGLLTVAMDSPIQTVDVLTLPAESPNPPRRNNKKRAALEKELRGRLVGENTGGVNRVKIMTAYRERSAQIACALKRLGTATVKALREDCGCLPSASATLSSNAYGWFRRVERGVYTLTEDGEAAISDTTDKAMATVVSYYMDSEMPKSDKMQS